VADREYRYDRVAGDRVRVPVGMPTGTDGPTGVDGQVSSFMPGALPLEENAVDQNWDSLRPELRGRLSGSLGAILVWWRDDDDPFRTTVSAFGERGMCLAEPATKDGSVGHRLDTRAWAAGSVKSHEFSGPVPEADVSMRERTGRDNNPGLALPPQVSALLGHFPSKAQRYLQVPLLAGGGATDGGCYYQTGEGLEHSMDAWLWLRAGRVVTFAQGRRERRGTTAHWELRCWRAVHA
jgi:hypothetical protein